MASDGAFSINALLFGDHLSLAQRCLSSLLSYADWSFVADVRIGMNDVCSETTRYVREVCGYLDKAGVRWLLFIPERNVGKYPLMRKMLYVEPSPAQYTMWLDDDSALRGSIFSELLRKMMGADMLGAVYEQSIAGQQWQWVQSQPWYANKLQPQNRKFKFATGGWWLIRSEILRRWNWPSPDIWHNGGDQMLGELIRQQGLRLRQHRSSVWINADEHGRISAAKRRGMHQKSIGVVMPPMRCPEFDFRVCRSPLSANDGELA